MRPSSTTTLTTTTLTTTHPDVAGAIPTHLDAHRARLEVEARSWDEYALRQRLVALNRLAQATREALVLDFPADLVPQRVAEAVADAADGLAEALAHLDGLHHVGAHRRQDAAEDLTACAWRDNMDAIHGGYAGRHRPHPHPRRRAAMRAEAARKAGQ